MTEVVHDISDLDRLNRALPEHQELPEFLCSNPELLSWSGEMLVDVVETFDPGLTSDSLFRVVLSDQALKNATTRVDEKDLRGIDERQQMLDRWISEHGYWDRCHVILGRVMQQANYLEVLRESGISFNDLLADIDESFPEPVQLPEGSYGNKQLLAMLGHMKLRQSLDAVQPLVGDIPSLVRRALSEIAKDSVDEQTLEDINGGKSTGDGKSLISGEMNDVELALVDYMQTIMSDC
jgi:hypothetical protein